MRRSFHPFRQWKPAALALVALGALVAAASGQKASAGEAGALPAVTALLTTESTQLDAEGVTRTSRFQERFVREGAHVWIERVYPAGMVPGHAEDEHGVNLRVASRWYEHVAGVPDVKVALVSVPDETIVDLAPSELGGLGLSPRWSIAAELVDLTKLVPSTEAAPAGAVWYVRAPAAVKGAPRERFRVLWDAKLRLPRVIESSSKDGRSSTRITVEASELPAGAPRPWTQVGKLGHRDLSDLED